MLHFFQKLRFIILVVSEANQGLINDFENIKKGLLFC